MKFNVTFQSTFPVDIDKHPRGEELADYLAARLRERGFEIVSVDNYDDFAWSLDFKTTFSPWLLVGHVGDGVYEWLIQINSGIGWLGRFFGRSDQQLLQSVTKSLHTILTEDACFSEIRWHEGDFAEECWSRSPE